MRFKHRYILCEISFQDSTIDQSINSSLIFSHLRRIVETNFGDYGAGCLQQSLNVKYYNPITGLAIIRCSRDHLRMIWNAVMMLTTLKNRSCMATCIHVGGTIRSCQKKALVYSRKIMLQIDLERMQSAQNRGKLSTTTVPATSLNCVNENLNQLLQDQNSANQTLSDAQIRVHTISSVPSATGSLTEFITPSLVSAFVQSEKELGKLLHENI